MTGYKECVAFLSGANGRTFAKRIGRAKPRDDGGMQVYLDVIPIGWDGNFVIQEPRDRNDGPAW